MRAMSSLVFAVGGLAWRCEPGPTNVVRPYPFLSILNRKSDTKDIDRSVEVQTKISCRVLGYD